MSTTTLTPADPPAALPAAPPATLRVGVTTLGADGGKSGISQYLIQHLRQFARSPEGMRFDVAGYDDERSLFLPDAAPMAWSRLSPRLRHPLASIAWHQGPLAAWCRRQAHDVLFLPAGNRRLPWSVPCPTVATVHDFSSLHVAGKYDAARLFYIKQVLPRFIRRVTRVLTVSESSKRDIVQYARVPEDRVTVTPLAVDHGLYRPGDRDEALEAAARYGVQRPYLLYVSRIEHPGKNHVRLIRAFARLKARGDLPHQLLLAGSDWNGAEQVHREAAAQQCADDIVFAGFVPNADLPALYRGAELFVFPSLYEGFGLPVLEAMACGVPVACSNTSSLPEVAGPAALQFDPSDEEALADALGRLIDDRDLRDRCVADGLQWSGRFTWEATARRTLEVIRAAAEA